MSYKDRTEEGITGRGSHNGGYGDLVILEGSRDRYEWFQPQGCASGLILESGFHQLPGWYGQALD